jgi:hypothetical protein
VFKLTPLFLSGQFKMVYDYGIRDWRAAGEVGSYVIELNIMIVI